MEKSEVLAQLQTYRDRLEGDVFQAYQLRGHSYGHERFTSWKSQFTNFLDNELPGHSGKLSSKLHRHVSRVSRGESDFYVFMRNYGNDCIAFIDSLKIDVTNDEINVMPVTPILVNIINNNIQNNKVFIVHGHDELLKVKAARFIEKLGLEAIILHEQANQGKTIIEKIETHTNVGFALVLYTSDDCGNTKTETQNGNLNARARQNVIFEHGYLIGKLSRSRVVPLVNDHSIELPSDIQGMVYVSNTNWEVDVAKEMKAAGYVIDFNKILGN